MTLAEKARARRIDCLKFVAESVQAPQNKRDRQVGLHLLQASGAIGYTVNEKLGWAC